MNQQVTNTLTSRTRPEKPRLSRNQSVVQVYLIGALLQYRDRYTIMSDPPLLLNNNLFTPHLCIYPLLTIEWWQDVSYITNSPLMVVEILSPNQTLDDMSKKINQYFEVGVQSCWLIQPMLRTIAVIEPEHEPHVFTTGKVTDPITGIIVSVEGIFR